MAERCTEETMAQSQIGVIQAVETANDVFLLAAHTNIQCTSYRTNVLLNPVQEILVHNARQSTAYEIMTLTNTANAIISWKFP